MTPEQLKASILQMAIQGKLVEQRMEEGTAEELYQNIQKEKQKLVKEGKIKKEKPIEEIKQDEIPFDIPDSWKWVYLKEVMSVYGGKRIPAGRKLIKENTGHIYIRVSDMKDGTVLDTDIHYVPNDIYPQIKNYVISKEDIYITVAGTIGRVGIIPEQFDNANLTENANKLVVYSLSKKYVMYLMSSSVIQNQITDATTKVGQPKLAIMRIEDMIIPIPPLKEQHRIVAKIEELLPYVDRYALAYEKLEQFNAKFPEEMKKSILQYAIQGKLVEQRSEEGTAEDLYQQIQEEKEKLIKEGKIKKEKPLAAITDDEIPFDIPASWKWVSIGNTCIGFEYGTAKKSLSNGKCPVLRMGNIQQGIVVYDKLVYSDDEDDIKKYHLEKGDLLFNRTNSKEWVGKTAIYKGEREAIYAGYLVRFKPILIDSRYLNYVMQSQYYWSFCQRERTDAIGQSNINAQKLKKFYFPLPPLSEQKRIIARLEELLPYCDQLIKRL